MVFLITGVTGTGMAGGPDGAAATAIGAPWFE